MSSSDLQHPFSGSSKGPDRTAPSRRAFLATGLVTSITLALGFVSGCTVRPLYGNVSPAGSGEAMSARLASIAIPPASDRVGQELRNHLIFMFGGGRGQPANPVYRLDLTTTARRSVLTTINTGRVNLEPTAGTMTVAADYRLSEIATGEVVAAGNRSIQTAYDIPAQEFAASRAVRDAENRAARELAELLRLVVAQELEG